MSRGKGSFPVQVIESQYLVAGVALGSFIHCVTLGLDVFKSFGTRLKTHTHNKES